MDRVIHDCCPSSVDGTAQIQKIFIARELVGPNLITDQTGRPAR